MQLDVDLSVLSIAAAKIKGVEAFFSALKEARLPYNEALEFVIEYVHDNRGTIKPNADKSVLKVDVLGHAAKVYAGGPGSLLFDFEML